MLIDQTNDLSLADLLDSLPDGVVWLKPVYDEQQTLINFCFVYVNQMVRNMSQASGMKLEPGNMLLTTEAQRPTYVAQRFDQMAQVLKTGEPFSYTQFNETLGGWFNVTYSQVNGGILSVARDVSESRRAEKDLTEQVGLTQAMLDGSLSGVLLLKPVMNENGVPDDFLILAANQTIGDITSLDSSQVIGKTMSEVYPGYKQGGFFALYCETYTDGEARRAEYYYDDTRLTGWFEVSIARQNDYLVLTTSNTTEAHTAREANERATRNLQSVIDHSQTGIFVFSPVLDDIGNLVDFRFKTINRMVAALVGQTPEVITGKVASDWFISYRETGLFDRYRHTYLTGEPQRFDIHYNVDGFDVWFDVQSARVDDDVLVTFTDYSLLKQAQQQVEQQAAANQQQASFINSVLDGSVSGILAFEAIRDPDQHNAVVDFRFVLANRACETILSKPIDEMLGRSLFDTFPGNWEAGLFDLYVHTTNTGQSGRTEIYYNHDGLDFWLDISAQQLGDGFVVTFTDISALKRANRAVEDAAAELVTVIDTSQTGIFLFTPVFNETGDVVDFRFRVANKQLAAYVGQQPETIIGGLGSQWFPDYMTNGLFELYRKSYVTGRTQRFDFHYDGSGIDVWLDIMSTKMGDSVLVTFTDYTALKKLQQQLENTIADLKRSNANLEQFAYVASHDLQEPLRKIQSFGDVLQTSYGDQLTEQATDLIIRMQTSASRMSALIRDLLAYSRLTNRTDSPKQVSIQTALERVLDDLDLTIHETGTTIHTGTLPVITGDELQFRQLLQNLLTNAIKFRPADGKPVVRIEGRRIAAAELPSIAVPLRQAAYYESITVADNGIGFDNRYAERIFQVFQRLHGRGQYEGTGIGLAIVQKVVDNHGGAIIANSAPGQGATFTIYLPV